MYNPIPQLSSTQSIILLFSIIITLLVGIYAINHSLLAIISICKNKKNSSSLKPHNWPKVSINIPLFNEKKVVSRLLDSCVNLDYPRDKLEILVVDDSNDETTRIAYSYEKKFPELVKVIHRNIREGYKAGALQLALEKSSGDFIAIFDADYVPPRDFLRSMIPSLYTDDQVAFVQARCTHLNEGLSWVTKAISLGMDGHGLVEQRGRSSANLLAHFSGTGGIFRRKSIEDVGGWHHDTLAEDLDLSMRLQLNGWKYAYLPYTTCPGEVPPKIRIFIKQQYRWAKGFTQCFIKHWKSVIKCEELSFFQKFEALMQLGTYFVYPFSLIGMFCTLLLLRTFSPNFFFQDFWNLFFAPIISIISIMIYSSPFIVYGITISELNRNNNKETIEIRRIFYLLFLGLITSITNTKGILEAFLQIRSPFNRTLKFGLIDKKYHGKNS
ncbi:glycosyltransferase [Candidatus Pacearchaeota archaeon]|nr:glycosyltransferase [Candidatus Pacearchaeota archaeon]